MKSTGPTHTPQTPPAQGALPPQDAFSPREPFSPQLAAVLADADRALQAMAGGGHHSLYHSLRVTSERLAPTDAFYVGFYAGDSAISFPYSFDGREYDDPSAIPYGEGGLSAWMLEHRRPYWSREDGGRLLRRGHRFGDTEQLSSDVIVVPIFDAPFHDVPGPDASPPVVIGLMSMQSYAPGSYDAGTVRAFAWLSGSLSTVLAREREDGRRRAALGGGAAQNPPSVADEVSLRLGELRRGVEAVARLVPAEAEELCVAVAGLREGCERAQTEIAELLAGAGPSRRADPLSGLTGRQREVACLLARGLGTREIAARLFLSEHTVRDHRRAVRGWLGVSDRSEVTARLRRALSPPE